MAPTEGCGPRQAAEEERSSAQQLGEDAAGCQQPFQVSLLNIAPPAAGTASGFCSDPSHGQVLSELGATWLLCDSDYCTLPPTPLHTTEMRHFPSQMAEGRKSECCLPTWQ